MWGGGTLIIFKWLFKSKISFRCAAVGKLGKSDVKLFCLLTFHRVWDAEKRLLLHFSPSLGLFLWIGESGNAAGVMKRRGAAQTRRAWRHGGRYLGPEVDSSSAIMPLFMRGNLNKEAENHVWGKSTFSFPLLKRP